MFVEIKLSMFTKSSYLIIDNISHAILSNTPDYKPALMTNLHTRSYYKKDDSNFTYS